ncbi:polar amino acid transport system substrate-binding protein [Chitinivorax tropicus]|uniref:Polar amino acid transport system substrate-binding protein n=1 Tax=Chitinivorax tropicus TaxID=714531 RepID=A0A840MIC9_9PROT|nr:transporter substrate-binding domain-containing protein [Chitinivorax tropicus]MBB5018160.1 polar amino acid transport system substrate-binding protein [Chitinivorax tropicus]
MQSIGGGLTLVRWKGWACLWVLVGVLASSARAELTIRLTNGEWPPYLSPTLPHDGLASRIVRAAFAERGIKVEYGFFPWKRAFELAKEGAWDGSVVWMKNREREQQFHFSAPVIHSDYVFFHRRGLVFDWREINDIRPYRIGLSDGYDYGKDVSASQRNGQLKVEVATSDLINLRKLAWGRIDLFPINRVVGLSMLSQLNTDEAERLTFHPKALQMDTLHLILNRKNPSHTKLIEEFNKGLESVRARGDIARFEQEAREPTFKQN